MYQVKEIPGFSGYFADTEGNIWTGRKGNGRKPTINVGKPIRKLKLSIRPDGYLSVSLCRSQKSFSKLVHRLVLETFVSPCSENMVACHYDGNQENNGLNNLRWDTESNNHKDKIRHGTYQYGENNPNNKLNDLQVRIIRKYPAYKNTIKDLSEIFHISEGTVYSIRNGNRWKHV